MQLVQGSVLLGCQDYVLNSCQSMLNGDARAQQKIEMEPIRELTLSLRCVIKELTSIVMFYVLGNYKRHGSKSRKSSIRMYCYRLISISRSEAIAGCLQETKLYTTGRPLTCEKGPIDTCRPSSVTMHLLTSHPERCLRNAIVHNTHNMRAQGVSQARKTLSVFARLRESTYKGDTPPSTPGCTGDEAYNIPINQSMTAPGLMRAYAVFDSQSLESYMTHCTCNKPVVLS